MSLFVDQIERINLNQLYLALLSIESITDNSFEDLLSKNSISNDEGGFHWNEGQSLETLNIDDSLIKSFLKNLTSQNINLLNEEIIYGITSLLWIRKAYIKRFLLFPHKLSITSILNDVDISGLQISLNHNSEVVYPFSIYMICFIRTLNQHSIVSYVEKTTNLSFKVIKKVGITSKEGNPVGHILHVDIDGQTDHLLSHKDEHIDDQMTILQANIDDMNPEILPLVMDKLFQNGANDVYFYPIIMKKGRSGMMLNALCKINNITALESVIFQETSTIGIRRLPVKVHRLGRTLDSIKTRWGRIAIKIAKYENKIVHVSPEFEDCKKAAIQHKIPLKIICQESMNRIASRFGRYFPESEPEGGKLTDDDKRKK